MFVPKMARQVTAAAAFLPTILLTSCVTTITPEGARGLSDQALCMQYGHWLRKGNPQAVSNVAAELSSRGGTPPSQSEHDIIRKESVAIGMSECGMLAALGANYSMTRHDIVTGSGRRTQHVGRPYSSRMGPVFVYTEGGRVTAVQN